MLEGYPYNDNRASPGFFGIRYTLIETEVRPGESGKAVARFNTDPNDLT